MTKADLKLIDISVYQKDLDKLDQFTKLRNLAESTQATYRRNAETFLAWCVVTAHSKPFENITYDDIRGFLAFLDLEKPAPRTVNTYIMTLSTMFYCIRHEKWEKPEVPCRKYDVFLPDVPSKEEAKRILLAAETPTEKAITFLLFSTGCRISEIREFRYQDLNRKVEAPYILVAPGKGHLERKVQFTDNAIEAVTKLCNEQTSHFAAKGIKVMPESYVFCNEKDPNKPLSEYMVRQAFASAVQKSGVLNGFKQRKITPHTARHFFGLHVYLQTRDLVLVKTLLGHKSLNATLVYVRLAAVEQFAASSALNPADYALS